MIDALTDTEAPRLGFTFRLSGGAGKLSLEDQLFFGWLRVDRLELDVPGLRLPVDLTAGPEIFQRQRTRVRVASLRVDQRDLDRFVARKAAALAELGVDELHVRTCDGHLAAECRVRQGTHVADLTFRLWLGVSDPSSLLIQLVADDARVYGYMPTPGSLLVHRILETLIAPAGSPYGADDRAAPRASALGVVSVAPLELLLWNTLPLAGWRLPSARHIAVIAARATRSSLQISYGPAPDPSALQPIAAGAGSLRARETHRDAEDRLRNGDIEGAIRAYRGALAAGAGDQVFVIGRLLELTCTQPTYFVDAIELARQALGRTPDLAAAHAALAAIAVAEDDWATAANRFLALAELAELAGDDEATVRAALAGARLLRTIDPPAATARYETVLALRPRHAEAAEALAERYTAEGRWHELVRLVRGRIETTVEHAARARDHIRLAGILADRLDDHASARVELERAIALDPHSTSALETLAGARYEIGDFDQAVATLEAAAALYAERGERRAQARVLARTAETIASRGDLDAAAARYDQALMLDPNSEAALEGAAALLEARVNRDREGSNGSPIDPRASDRIIELRTRLVEAATHPADMARHSCELGRCLLARGDSAGARAALLTAAESSDPELRAQARALLAASHEADADRAGAARELADAVDALIGAAERGGQSRAQELNRRAAELALARAEHLQADGDEAAARAAFELAHSLAATASPDLAREAAHGLWQQARARKDLEVEKRWLEELVTAEQDASTRAELLLSRAEAALRETRYESALADARAANHGDASPVLRARAFGLEAQLHHALGDHDARARALESRAEFAPRVLDSMEARVHSVAAWLEAGDAQAALEAARRAVATSYLEPTDLAATDEPVWSALIDDAHAALGDAAWRKRQWDDVARGYVRLLEVGPASERSRRSYRYGVARRAMGDEIAARRALTTALEAEVVPPDVRANAARELADLHLRAGHQVAAARTLEALAADPGGGDPGSRADALYRAGDLYTKDAGHEADAERCLEAALRLAGDHMPALDALERIKRAQGDSERVAVILGRKIAATARHPARQKALLARLATLQGELGRTDVARATFARALDIDPEFRPALLFEARDAESAGDLERAADIYERLSLGLAGDDELGDDTVGVADERLDALRALERIYRVREEFGALADTLTRLSAVMHARGDERAAAALRDEVRALSGEPATREAHARTARALAGASDERSPEETLALAKNYRELEREHDAIEALEASRDRGQLSEDSSLLLFELHAECAHKRELAAALERGVDPHEVETSLARLRKALHLYEQSLGDTAGAERVRARMEELVAPVDDGSTAAVAHRHAQAIGERARRLSREGKSLDPVTVETLERLREVARAGRHWETLVEGVMTAAAVELEPSAAAGLLREAAAIMRAHQQDIEGAADALGRALAHIPRDAELMGELDGLLRELGDFARLAASYEQHLAGMPETERAPALYQLALIHAEVWRDEDAAGNLLERANQDDPNFGPVWLPLAGYYLSKERLIEARRLYENAGERLELSDDARAGVVSCIATIDAALGASVAAEARADTAAHDRALARAAELEAHGQLEPAVAAFEEAAALDPLDPRPNEALVRLYERTGDADGLSEVLGRQISLTGDGKARAQLWRRRARLYRDVLHREPETYRCLKEAYANDPDSGYIAYELRSVAMVRGEWALAAELLYAEIAAAEDRQEAAALHHELALIFDEKLVDAEQALVNYEQAVSLDPQIPASPRPLARLYDLSGRHEEAMRMAELAAERARDPIERGRLLKRAAMSAERAGLTDEARRLYNLAAVTVADDEDSQDAHDALARLSGQSDDPFSRGELLELQLSEETDRDRRIDLLRQMLDAALEANDAGAVRRHAEALLELQPEDASAYLALKARATSAGDWDALASLLDTRASGTADPSERASRFYELGRLYLDQLQDANAGIAAFEQALAARPDHPAALEAVARIAYEKADWPRARELFERMRPETATLAEDMLWFRRGEIAEALGREREALQRFREATRVAPSNRAALTAIVRAARRLGEHEAALEAMRALVELLPPEDVAASTQARLQLGDLHRQLGDRAEAIEYYLMVLREDPRSRPAFRALVELYIELGNYPEAARALGALTGLASSPGQQAELLFRRGELYLGPIGDPDLAADCYLKAIDLAPTHVPTLRRLIDYFWRIEDYQSLLEIAIELDAQRALLGTDPLPLARALLASGMRKAARRAVAIAGALGSETVAALAEVLCEADASGVDAQRLAAAAAQVGAAVPDLDLSAVLARISAREPNTPLVGHLLAALNASH